VGLYLYDEALVNKIKSWMPHTQSQVYGPDETRRMFEIIADESNDKPIKLPIICVKRGLGFNLNSTTKRPLSFDGFSVEASVKKSMQLNAISITIPYQIDIYTRYMKEADEYARSIIFNIVNSPKVTVTIPYNNVELEHDSNLRLSHNIDDNSSIPERAVAGQFTRYTLNIEMDDAYLFDARIRENYTIEANIDY
jgi:hypothetical protein